MKSLANSCPVYCQYSHANLKKKNLFYISFLKLLSCSAFFYERSNMNLQSISFRSERKPSECIPAFHKTISRFVKVFNSYSILVKNLFFFHAFNWLSLLVELLSAKWYDIVL